MSKRNQSLIILGVLAVSLSAVYAATPGSFDIKMKDTEIDSTDAGTFKTNVTQLSEEYDAIWVWWNYTQGTSINDGEQKVAAGKISMKQGEVLEYRQEGLQPGTTYTVKSYSQPINWSDQNLVNNWIEKVELVDRGGGEVYLSKAIDNIVSSNTAMDGIIGTSTGVKFLMKNESAGKRFWNDGWTTTTVSSGSYTSEGKKRIFGKSGTLHVDWRSNQDWPNFKIIVNGNTEYSGSSSTGSTQEATAQISEGDEVEIVWDVTDNQDSTVSPIYNNNEDRVELKFDMQGYDENAHVEHIWLEQ